MYPDNPCAPARDKAYSRVQIRLVQIRGLTDHSSDTGQNLHQIDPPGCGVEVTLQNAVTLTSPDTLTVLCESPNGSSQVLTNFAIRLASDSDLHIPRRLKLATAALRTIRNQQATHSRYAQGSEASRHSPSQTGQTPICATPTAASGTVAFAIRTATPSALASRRRCPVGSYRPRSLSPRRRSQARRDRTIAPSEIRSSRHPRRGDRFRRPAFAPRATGRVIQLEESDHRQRGRIASLPARYCRSATWHHSSPSKASPRGTIVFAQSDRPRRLAHRPIGRPRCPELDRKRGELGASNAIVSGRLPALWRGDSTLAEDAGDRRLMASVVPMPAPAGSERAVSSSLLLARSGTATRQDLLRCRRGTSPVRGVPLPAGASVARRTRSCSCCSSERGASSVGECFSMAATKQERSQSSAVELSIACAA